MEKRTCSPRLGRTSDRREAAPNAGVISNSAVKRGFTLALIGGALASLAFASAEAAPAPAKRAPTPRDVQVDSVKESYWNRTSDGDLEVVQNRQYEKKNRLSLGVSVGTVSTDPFFTVYSFAGTLGFHFSESIGISAIYRKFAASESSYYSELRSGLQPGLPSDVNTNKPNNFVGGEIVYSPLYGKISLFGTNVIHYDAHVLLGAGMTDTVSGKYFTPTIGFGPQFYLNNTFALGLDYRLAIFKEDVLQTALKNASPIAGSRTNYMHQVALGLTLFL